MFSVLSLSLSVNLETLVCLRLFSPELIPFFSFEGQLQHLLGIGGFVGVSALMVIDRNIAALS